MTFTIRLASPADIIALQRIEISASQAFASIPGLEAFADDSCMSDAQHMSAITPQTNWIAETSDGTAAGFLAALAEEDVLHVYELSVHFEHQKQGIGAHLMNHAEAWAKTEGLKGLTLTTYQHVPWNAPFYERLGFQILPDRACGPRLAKLLDGERSSGLPFPEKRCAMRKDLA